MALGTRPAVVRIADGAMAAMLIILFKKNSIRLNTTLRRDYYYKPLSGICRICFAVMLA
ncbi:hypothetical protein [uncultured Parasphingorhabdus sp.]|uniref:hypothetical protein n=1 Tax=uncultured Parasphingorhabdus sp. TaxID=2709694 RepID=UPI002AA89166|nr:hypothetical protein [uncultured Parasphingorhabdus sp.]